MRVCTFCNFSCKYESDYNRHLNSKKHKEKLEGKNLCDGCFKEFSTKSSKIRHEKKCEIIRTNIETQNNIRTQNNTTNNITNNTINNFIINDKESLKSFVMEIAELVNKQTTDCFQKLLLNEMASQKYHLMNYVEKFDTKLNEAYNDMINDHNINCKSTSILDKIDENGK